MAPCLISIRFVHTSGKCSCYSTKYPADLEARRDVPLPERYRWQFAA